ncbi:MAG: aminoglycoside phosphotransferase family protein [Alphaproteobacteria bacterium]|nr:aminoglycoside phosphotransferase family protein [Alphaproteobacteria bacterium]
MFKKNWETIAQNIQVNPHTIQSMVEQARPNEKILAYEVISQGCANLNIKLTLSNEPSTVLLRIYIRDEKAAYREQKLAQLIHLKIPVPEVYFVGNSHGHTYALVEFKSGILLRDLLLHHPASTWKDVMEDTGYMVSVFHSYHFPHAGFFDEDLAVINQNYGDDFLKYVEKCLQNTRAQNELGKTVIQKIHKTFQSHSLHLPSSFSLVHGDYDPANIMVDKKDGIWSLNAILDWEFAHAGDWLLDVANMVRYAHKMPSVFEESFIKGLQKGGMILPEDWRIIIYLFNLGTLLDCLTSPHPKARPHQAADIRELITHILSALQS